MYKKMRGARAGFALSIPRAIQHTIESLESRRLLADISWDGGGDGVNWSDANNWSSNALPTAADDVTISIAANPTIQLAGVRSVNSLVTDELINVTGTLSVAVTATLNARM